MAAFCDSTVDFIGDTEEDEAEERAKFNRRHQELVRKLKSKKDTTTGPLLAQSFSGPEKTIISNTTQSSILPAKTVTSPTITMDISEPQIPQDTDTVIEESSLDQNCGQHSYKTEMFCKDCRLLVCAICFLFGDHKGHDSADIPETRDIVTRLLSEQRHQAAAGRIKAQVTAKVEIIGEEFKGLAEKVQDFLEALKELEINCVKNLEEDIHKRLKVAQPDYIGILRYIESVGISDGRVIISEEEGTVTMSLPGFKITESNKETVGHDGRLAVENIIRGANKTDSEKALVDDNDNLLDDNKEAVPGLDNESMQESRNIILDIISNAKQANIISQPLSSGEEFELKREDISPPILADSPQNESALDFLPATSVPDLENNDEDIEVLDHTDGANIVFVESPEKIHIRKKRYKNIWTRFEEAIRTESFKADYITRVLSKGDWLLILVEGKWYRGAYKGPHQGHNDEMLFKIKLIDIGRTVIANHGSLREISQNLKVQECYTEAVRLDVETPGGGEEWPASTLDWLSRKLRRDDEVLVRALDSGREKTVDLIKVIRNLDNPFEPEKVTHFNITKLLTDQGLALKRGTRQRVSHILTTKSRTEEESKVVNISRLHDGAHCDPLYCLQPSIKPRIPQHQVFEAMVTHVDERAVVWVVPREDLDTLADITAGCLECGEPETEVIPGLLCVARLGKNITRLRILKELEDGALLCMDVDSGEIVKCSKDNLFKISPSLLHIPPLAVPVKLYGVKRSREKLRMEEFLMSESISGAELGLVTVAVLEDHVDTLPMPANIFFSSDGDKYGGNLAFRMLKIGMVKVIVTYKEWNEEYNDHALEWLIGMEGKLHELSHLPFPLPMSVGMWLHVSVEGQEFKLKDGEEIEPTVHCTDASKVGLRLCPVSSNAFEAEDQVLHSEIKPSLRITEEQVTNLTVGFMKLKQRLQESAETAAIPEKVWPGKLVLGLYQDHGISEWCRVYLSGEATRPEYGDSVWAFFVDYGHRARVKTTNIRMLEAALAREPVFILEADFKMPDDNHQLRTIRKEIKDVKGEDVKMMIQVEKIVPQMYPDLNKILVSFSKAIKTEGHLGSHVIAKIC